MTNGTVTSIQAPSGGETTFSVQVTYLSGETAELRARSIVLATGLKDIIPNTPGLFDCWGKGVYWVSSRLHNLSLHLFPIHLTALENRLAKQ